MSPRPKEDRIETTGFQTEYSKNSLKLKEANQEENVGRRKVKRHPEFERMQKPFGLELVTYMRILIIHAHIIGAYALYLTFTGRIPFSTILFDILFVHIGGFGITVGCHRYWAHKTFKANKKLQILLMCLQTMALQHTIQKWCLEHRIHHKFTDTDKDPHNSKRGFFFCHIGWLLTKRHPEFQKAMDEFEMPDIENDPIVRFQSRWFWPLVVIFHFIIPISFVYFVWRLPLLYCIAISYRRYIINLHNTFNVNSIAHMIGDKPYDKNISSTENAFVAVFAAGEGWHNYHHTFPWDYKASELGWKINLSTMFIDFFAWLGWAYDLKTVSQKMLKQRLRRTGDGSHADAKLDDNDGDWNDFEFNVPADVTEMVKNTEPVWGWDDEIMSEEFKSVTKILKPKSK